MHILTTDYTDITDGVHLSLNLIRDIRVIRLPGRSPKGEGWWSKKTANCDVFVTGDKELWAVPPRDDKAVCFALEVSD